MAIALSYVLTTRNKLPYLREVLADLIAAKRPDEEILISDGASTDGTADYLQELLNQKKIDFFVSEPDVSEGHGFNKVLLRAQGELIKIISDDDAFYYPGIQKCREFMLAHPAVDFLSTDGVKRRKNGSLYPMGMLTYRVSFAAWLRTRTPFDSCGLGIMMRRSSLPLLGLFDPNFVRTDAEYTLRTTAGKGTVAWYALECYVRILNSQSNTTTQQDRYYRDTERLEALYFGKRASAWSAIIKAAKKIIKPWFKPDRSNDESAMSMDDWRAMYKTSSEWLQKNGAENTGDFLWQK